MPTLDRHQPVVKEILSETSPHRGRIRNVLPPLVREGTFKRATGARVLGLAFLLPEEFAMRPFSLRTLAPAFVVLPALFGCGGGSSPSDGGGGGPVETTSVMVRDNFFEPSAIRVAPGATVTWTFSGSEQHNVTFSNPAIQSSENQSSGLHSAAMPATAGTYTYSCSLHAGMNGSVQVQ